jgi:hypothetical protein
MKEKWKALPKKTKMWIMAGVAAFIVAGVAAFIVVSAIWG